MNLALNNAKTQLVNALETFRQQRQKLDDEINKLEIVIAMAEGTDSPKTTKTTKTPTSSEFARKRRQWSAEQREASRQRMKRMWKQAKRAGKTSLG